MTWIRQDFEASNTPNVTDYSVKVDGNIISTARSSDLSFYVNNSNANLGIPLKQNQPVNVEVLYTNGITNSIVKQSISWEPLNISSSSNFITIRRGDSLLFTVDSEKLNGAVSIDGNGDGAYELEGKEGDKFPVEFKSSGNFTVIGKVGDQVAGTIVVNVIDVDFDGPIACEIGFRRNKTIKIISGNNEDVKFTGNETLEVSSQVESSDGSNLKLKPLTSGEPILFARLNGKFGPIIKKVEVDEFTFLTQAKKYIGLVEEYEDGSMLVQTNMQMSEKISSLEFRLNIFVSGVTFEDSSLKKILYTDNFTSTIPALHPYQMIANPGIKTGTCHNIKVYQRGVLIGQ